MQLSAHFELVFTSAPWLNHLTSLHIVTRRPILQKVRDHTWIVVLSLLVSIRFQVLFHSPPGVLFTVPSRYYSLSVIRSYLAFGDGPPFFPPDSSCPVVLWISLSIVAFRLQVCHLLWSFFPKTSTMLLSNVVIRTPDMHRCTPGLGSFPFARHYLGNRWFTFSSSG